MNNIRHRLIKSILLYLAASLFIGVPFALLNGAWPKNLTGWLIVAAFGFPAILFGEFLGEKIFSKKISDTVDRTGKDRILSARRMLYALIVITALIALGSLVQHLLSGWISVYFKSV
jgi:hypothetical protein